MKCTQAELEGMSDLELNLIAAYCFGILNPTITDGKLVGAIKRIGVVNINAIIDYCNNWSDCGALIDELNETVDLTVKCDLARVETGESGRLARSDNNKRAVTIIYILIKQDA